MNKETDKSDSGAAPSIPGPRIHRARKDSAKKSRKILVVDDNKIILKTTATKLRDAGYEVLTAEDGGSAIRQVRQLQPDLIILDLNFPADVGHGGGIPWDGFLIISWLRQMVGAEKIPVIVITGGDVEKHKDRWEEAGVLDVFLKPIDHEALLATIRWNLDKDAVAQDPAPPAPLAMAPLDQPPAERTAQQPAEQTEEPPPAVEASASKKVLFVDDTSDWRYLASVSLGEHGYEVATAEDAIGATLQVTEFKPDLVVLDLNLCGESGVVLLKLLSDLHPDLPVLIYTGMDLSEAEISELHKNGAWSFLRKGGLEDLVTAVGEILHPSDAEPVEKQTEEDFVLAAANGSHATARTEAAPECHSVIPSLQDLRTGTTEQLLDAVARARCVTPDQTEEQDEPESDGDVSAESIESAAESILIVEDDAAFEQTLSSFLESQSFRVSTVTTGEAAVSLIEAVDVDLILFDLTLQDMRVQKFYEAVQAVKPHLCPRIIFMSSDDSHAADDGFVRRQKGISIWKPFQMDWLLEAVQTVRSKTQPDRLATK
jgi:DNA-binding response OmpR family regulator